MNLRCTIGCVGAMWLLGVIGGCASDGGVGGTGISTVRGNVLREARVPAGAGGSLSSSFDATAAAGIIVREPVSGVEDETDANGRFEIEGTFPTNMELWFLAPGQVTPSVLELTVPDGATLTVENVWLEDHTADVEAVRIATAPGLVLADATCDGKEGQFELDLSGTVFLVSFGDGAIANGRSCADLRSGVQVEVLGTQQGTSIAAESVKITKSKNRTNR